MMNCDQARLRLTSYMDGESPNDERKKIEEHLSSCAACRQELEEMRRTAKLAGSWKVEGVADLWGTISDAIDDEPAAQIADAENQSAAMMTLLLDMQREIRDLRSEVADLRSELSGRIGSLSMRTRMPVDNTLPLGAPWSQPQRIPGSDPTMEYTRMTSANNPQTRKWPVKVEEDDLWN